MRKTKSAIHEAVHKTAKNLHAGFGFRTVRSAPCDFAMIVGAYAPICMLSPWPC